VYCDDLRREHRIPRRAQCRVDLRHARLDAERRQAGDPVPADAARHDAAEMRQVRRDVQCHAMPAHPAADADADGADLGLGPRRGVGHPDADATFPAFAAHVEPVERADQPFLQAVHEAPHVARRHRAVRARQIEHHIGDPLAGTMIGPLPAASGGIAGEAGRVGEFRRPRRGSGGVERRMFHQPDLLARRPGPDRRDARGHRSEGVRIGRQALGAVPLRGIRQPAAIRVAGRAGDHRVGDHRVGNHRVGNGVAGHVGLPLIEAPSFIRYTAPPAGARSAAPP